MFDTDLIRDNPIFVRELRRRMRGKGLIVTLLVYLTALCGFAFLIIATKSSEIVLRQSGAYYTGSGTISDIGQGLYAAILTIQAILVLILAPTMTASMVRSEKERETFDFLRVTTLSAPMYVVGALLSTVLYVALALFCAMPVLALAYLYGGISNIVPTLILLLCSSVLLSSFGLLVSCVTERYGGNQLSTSIVVTLLILAFMLSRLLNLSVVSGPIFMHSVTVGFATLRNWQIISLLWLAVSVVLLLIASRKLYRPEDRALTYTQSAVFFLACHLVWFITVLIMAGSHSPGIAEVTMNLLLYLVTCILCVNNALFTRVDTGNERWKLKKSKPALRNSEEGTWAATLFAAVGGIIPLLILLLLVGDFTAALWMLLPCILFMFAHILFSRILMKTVLNEFTALRYVIILDVILIGGTLLAVSLSPAYAEKWMRLTVGMVSPLALSPSISSSTGTGDYTLEMFRSAFLLGIVGFLALVDWNTSPRHENTHVNYELGL